MSSTDITDTIEPSQLPAVIRTFLRAHEARDADTAARAFTPGAVVTDQGETFSGTEQVRSFLGHAGAEFTYTSRLVGARRTDDRHWTAVIHLEGDFPGGVANLDYRFTLADDLISELAIG